MSSGQGSTTNLALGGQEALRALINSIAPETAAENDGKLTPETVKKLSEKLKEIVGEEAAKDFEHHRNEMGELVNEEGLPIIEISEPLPHTEEESGPNDQSTIQDIPLINFSSLPSVAREKLRQQRDRVLDILEEEERQEDERQERVEREEREELIRKHKEGAVNDQARLQKAKELQKKMGKALLRNMDSGKENDPSPVQGGSKDFTDQSDTNLDTRRKTVTFVETGDSVSNAEKPDWGDVTAAKLRPGQRPTLLQSVRSDGNPVKLNVIERKPAGPSSGTPALPVTFTQTAKDSDDESEPGDDQFSPASDDDESDETQTDQHLDSEEGNEGVELEDQYDLDYARHQREIALEYYEKRNAIGQETMKAMVGHTHNESEDEVTPEVPVQNNEPRASISRFKANRIASAYGSSSHSEPSTSVAESVVPESMARTIQHAIRSGRIDDSNRLVGAEHDSDSENEAQELQETLELLRKGEVYNLGPEGHLFTAPQGAILGDISTGSGSSTASQQRTQQPQRELPSLNRPKVSKFKANLSQAGRPSSTSRSTTPISHVDRSSPKLPSALADTIVEKKQPQSTNALGTSPSHTSLPLPSGSLAPAITESSSVRAPRPIHPQMNATPQPIIPIIVESPSFPNQSGPPASSSVTAGSGTSLPPTMSMIVDSPSFPPPGQRSRRLERPPTVVPSQGLAAPSTSKAVAAEGRAGSIAVSKGTHSSPSPAITPVVKERVASRARVEQVDDSQGNGPKKVSKFKQARDTQS